MISIFEVVREEEVGRFRDEGNRMLLFHGSRLTNFVGILSQGLRIAPPEAPVTGYMFGKGIYFADVSTKSANYCCANRDSPEGLLLICEVSLGKPRPLVSADYEASRLPADCSSTMGVGRHRPTEFAEVGGSRVPCGGLVEGEGQFDLLYN